MARPQQPYDDQYGQHDSYYQDDYAQGHPQGHPHQQQHAQYDQGYDQQGDGYYDEQCVANSSSCNHAYPLFFLVTITMPVSTMPMANKKDTITMGEAAMRTITTVTNTMVETNTIVTLF